MTDMWCYRLRDELCTLKEKWDREVVNVSRNQVSKDLELEALRDNESRVKADLQQRKEDIERYVTPF